MKKVYIKPEICIFDTDKQISVFCVSGPGNSGNAPGHNKDENGHPIHPHKKGLTSNPFEESPF